MTDSHQRSLSAFRNLSKDERNANIEEAKSGKDEDTEQKRVCDEVAVARILTQFSYADVGKALADPETNPLIQSKEDDLTTSAAQQPSSKNAGCRDGHLKSPLLLNSFGQPWHDAIQDQAATGGLSKPSSKITTSSKKGGARARARSQ